MRTYEPMAGECISETASKMVALAAEHNCEVTASFNEITLFANRLSSAGDIQQFYSDESEKRAKAYRESPEFKARELEYAGRERQKQLTLQGALSVAPPMAFKDEAAWQKSVATNKDGYGACVMRYAEKWARLMQAAVAEARDKGGCLLVNDWPSCNCKFCQNESAGSSRNCRLRQRNFARCRR